MILNVENIGINIFLDFSCTDIVLVYWWLLKIYLTSALASTFLLDSQEVLDAEVIHLINADVSMSLRQNSVLCLLLGSAVFQRNSGAPGCRGPGRCQGLMKPALCHSWQRPASSTGSWLRKCPRLCWRQVLVCRLGHIFTVSLLLLSLRDFFEFEYLFGSLLRAGVLNIKLHAILYLSIRTPRLTPGGVSLW